MKITLDIPEKDLKDMMRYSGEIEEGAAVVKLLTSQLMLRKRRELSEKSLVEAIPVKLPDWTRSRVGGSILRPE